MRTESFDSDPHWESYRSRLKPDPPRLTRQDFGPRPANHFGSKLASEIGGWIQRSATAAFYAKTIALKTLRDQLSASGKFVVTKSQGSSGMLFGWFNKDSRGWRTPNSLALRIDGEKDHFRVFYEYGTQHWLTGGGGCFEGEHYQTTPTKPFPADGSVHTWTLNYNPEGHAGDGLLIFTLDGKKYERPLAPGHKQDDAIFDRFGIFNQQSSGNGLEVYFADLLIDGKAADLTGTQDWEAKANQAEFTERIVRPFHDFGFTNTGRVTGKSGEIGGIIWRDERPAYYAAKVGPLSLDNELFASGKLVFAAAGSDSAAYLGWFDSQSKTNQTNAESKTPSKNFLGLLLEGPSRIGHYLRPAYRSRSGKGATMKTGPIIRPDGKPHEFSIHYLPDATGGATITMKLDGQTETMHVRPEDRKAGATFDRFGLFNAQEGGLFVELYLDDLSYTTTASSPAK